MAPDCLLFRGSTVLLWWLDNLLSFIISISRHFIDLLNYIIAESKTCKGITIKLRLFDLICDHVTTQQSVTHCICCWEWIRDRNEPINWPEWIKACLQSYAVNWASKHCAIDKCSLWYLWYHIIWFTFLNIEESFWIHTVWAGFLNDFLMLPPPPPPPHTNSQNVALLHKVAQVFQDVKISVTLMNIPLAMWWGKLIAPNGFQDYIIHCKELILRPFSLQRSLYVFKCTAFQNISHCDNNSHDKAHHSTTGIQ